MMAVVTVGNGGFDKLAYREVPLPEPGPGEVLLRVLAAGVNNTEINTRLGWYSSSVTTGTGDAAGDQESAPSEKADGGWNAATPFPFIQGTDCCGQVVAFGSGVAPDAEKRLRGTRVLVRPCMRPRGFGSFENIWMASDFDGAFAQYVKVPVGEVFSVACDWSDAELATIPCAYGTAENLLHRANLKDGESILITGASGGVGSAAVQLAKRRGAKVVAVCSASKKQRLMEIGADRVIGRDEDLQEALGQESVDAVLDIVAGSGFASLLKVLKRGGRYASSGAIGGPLVTLDMRDFYLKDLTLFGATAWDETVFPDLVGYIERGEIRPLLAQTYPLAEIVAAQKAFLEKKHVGNFVLIPPPAD